MKIEFIFIGGPWDGTVSGRLAETFYPATKSGTVGVRFSMPSPFDPSVTRSQSHRSAPWPIYEVVSRTEVDGTVTVCAEHRREQ